MQRIRLHSLHHKPIVLGTASSKRLEKNTESSHSAPPRHNRVNGCAVNHGWASALSPGVGGLQIGNERRHGCTRSMSVSVDVIPKRRVLGRVTTCKTTLVYVYPGHSTGQQLRLCRHHSRTQRRVCQSPPRAHTKHVEIRWRYSRYTVALRG